MTSRVGDVILVLRRAADITQEELAENLGITQAALSRYENDLREPDDEMTGRLADSLGVTVAFLRHDFRMQGAIATDAHMRRQNTTKPSDWKRIEARLNSLRMHSSYLLERAPLRAVNHVIHVDPDDHSPADAASMLRAAWRVPIGTVRNLTRWVESAGVLIVEEDFGTTRIDGMSQWAGEHALIILNSSLPVDRKRLTIAHELGHLVLHNAYVNADVEEQANEFAAEFLMPQHIIEPELTSLSLGKLSDLKLEWGVSMQAIFERAHRLGRVTAEDRRRFYRQMNSRGWKTREPGSDLLAPEAPELARSIGWSLEKSGLSQGEIRELIGIDSSSASVFSQPARTLRAV